MSTIKANTLLHSDGSTTNPPAIPALDKRMAKAWVNFNGVGTVAINSSYGVSSITDVAVSKYRANFTNAMPNADYAVVAGVLGATSSLYNAIVVSDGQALNTAYVALQCMHISGGTPDTNSVNVIAFAN